MASRILTDFDADYSALGYGKGDSPFSIKPWAAYAFGAKHVDGCDVTNLQDFCGAQGAAVDTGTIADAADGYSSIFNYQNYREIPITATQWLQHNAGGSFAVMLKTPAGAYASPFGGGSYVTPPSGKAAVAIYTDDVAGFHLQMCDSAGSKHDWAESFPGNADTQWTMLAGVFTETSLQGFAENSAGRVTTAPFVFTGADFSGATENIRVGYYYDTPTFYPGNSDIGLICLWDSNQTDYLNSATGGTFYAELQAWWNEHGLGL